MNHSTYQTKRPNQKNKPSALLSWSPIRGQARMALTTNVITRIAFSFSTNRAQRQILSCPTRTRRTGTRTSCRRIELQTHFIGRQVDLPMHKTTVTIVFLPCIHRFHIASRFIFCFHQHIGHEALHHPVGGLWQ